MWGLFGGAILVISIMTLREFSLFRSDQKSGQDVYPYTKSKLWRRIGISLLLVAEALLLLPLRETLLPSRPTWFLIYVTLAFIAAGGMVLLAWVDFRESQRLHQEGKVQLMKEFLQELQEDRRDPPLH